MTFRSEVDLTPIVEFYFVPNPDSESFEFRPLCFRTLEHKKIDLLRFT